MVILPSGEMWSVSGLIHVGNLEIVTGGPLLKLEYVGEADCRLLYDEDAVAFRKYAEKELWEYDTREDDGST